MADHYVFPDFASLRSWVVEYDLGLSELMLDTMERDVVNGKASLADLSRFVINLPIKIAISEDTEIENFAASVKFKQMQAEFGSPDELFE